MSRSDGSRLLGALEMTQLEIGRRVGVSRATVAMWIAGERVPNHDHRLALVAAFRIPLAAWPRDPRDEELERLRVELARSRAEWGTVRDTVVRVLVRRAPAVLVEIVDEIERTDTGR